VARIAGVNVPSSKRLVIALTYILGIGKKFSNDICSTVNIDKNKRVNSLSEDEIIKIRECIDKNYVVEGDLRRSISSNIKTGFDDLTRLIFCKILPGMDPM